MQGNYQRMVAFIQRVVQHTCCLCDNCCMACDAKKLLVEIGEYKQDIDVLEAINYKPADIGDA